MKSRFVWMWTLTAITLFSGCNTIGNRNPCGPGGGHGGCGPCQTSCRPGPIGWQRGGTDYQRFLNQSSYCGEQLGSMGPFGRENCGSGNGYQNHLGHDAYRYQQAGSGVPTAQIAYPYYTNRGPRDFLINNPPTIGR